MCTKFRLENLKGRDHLEDQAIDWRLRMDMTGIGWELVDLI
jgi:hypothetical protein